MAGNEGDNPWLKSYKAAVDRLFLDRCKCIDVRHPLHHQRLARLLGVLAHIFHHGSSVFWWEVLQMSRR